MKLTNRSGLLLISSPSRFPSRKTPTLVRKLAGAACSPRRCSTTSSRFPIQSRNVAVPTPVVPTALSLRLALALPVLPKAWEHSRARMSDPTVRITGGKLSRDSAVRARAVTFPTKPVSQETPPPSGFCLHAGSSAPAAGWRGPLPGNTDPGRVQAPKNG